MLRDGSSPRVRGKQSVIYRRISHRRIIPARAGQTANQIATNAAATDHPRACGANQLILMLDVWQNGSSPRVRGKHDDLTSTNTKIRIIPARAGQTSLRLIRLVARTDHPRACGANAYAIYFVGDRVGSSPRVRGKQSDFMRKLLSAGPSIIGFAQWLQSSCYCSCFQSSAKTPISRGTTPTSLFLGFQNSITLLLLT